MGAWSAAIMGNDTSAEVYEYFKRMYKYQEGNRFKWSLEDITDSLYTYYIDTIVDLPSERSAFFFALALALWERNALTHEIRSICKYLVDERIDYNAWKELDADEKTLKKRLAATQQFLEKINTHNPAPVTRQLMPAKLSGFVLGDCLAFQHQNKYYGLVVLEDGRNVDDGTNMFAFTDIKKDTVPGIEDFCNAQLVLNEDFANALSGIHSDATANPPVIFMFRFSKGAVEKAKKEFIYVGNLPMPRTHYERTSVRVTDHPGKMSSLKNLAIKAIGHWKTHPPAPSGCWLAADTKAPGYSLTATHLKLPGHNIPLANIQLALQNSLWHIDAWLSVDGVPASVMENNWLAFVDLITARTGREVNTLTILSSAGSAPATMQPLNTVEFDKYRMRHLSDDVDRWLSPAAFA